jgi:deoxyribonuclease V
MIAACDCHYWESTAGCCGVLFRDWDSERPLLEFREIVRHVERYEPGSFYRRELPCLLMLLEQVKGRFEMVVIDGYVGLGKEERPGLGAHLFSALGETIPVIGVAKTPFRGATHARTVMRGRSRRPLYITSAGIDIEEAGRNIQAMHGPHRIPTLLKRVDRLCRESIQHLTTVPTDRSSAHEKSLKI